MVLAGRHCVPLLQAFKHLQPGLLLHIQEVRENQTPINCSTILWQQTEIEEASTAALSTEVIGIIYNDVTWMMRAK